MKLSNNERVVLEDIEKVLRNREVVRRYMELAPPWILDKAVKEERINNWVIAYVPVLKRM